MGVFRDHLPEVPLYQVVTWRPGETLSFKLCADKSTHCLVLLHWIRDAGRSIPCSEDGCKMCGVSPTRRCIYVPAVEWYHHKQQFVRKIVPLNESSIEMVKQDNFGSAYWKGVRGKFKNSPVVWSESPTTIKLPDCPAFLIRDTLLWMWGMMGPTSDPTFKDQ